MIPRRLINRIMLRAIECLQSVFLKTPRHYCTAPISSKVAVLNVDVATMCVIPPLCDPERGQSISEQSSSLCCTKHTVFGVGGRLEPESFPPIPGLLRCTLLHLQPTPKKQRSLLLPSKQFIRNHCKISGELCCLCSCL